MSAKALKAYVFSERFALLPSKVERLDRGAAWRGVDPEGNPLIHVYDGVRVQVAQVVFVELQERFPAGWRKMFKNCVMAWRCTSAPHRYANSPLLWWSEFDQRHIINMARDFQYAYPNSSYARKVLSKLFEGSTRNTRPTFP